ncbi:hypothetical protein AVEN_112787-1 [Araneus ventricosus]|uniref:GAG-pre-integrase domain-containing protein n=1 Tax=Araneus ventricosus TaxID=182803 RepID=A0A4Y2JBC7_ARAVE|nr:hypothetical protein AVEN_112787-1 [Araneus ventricosus]
MVYAWCGIEGCGKHWGSNFSSSTWGAGSSRCVLSLHKDDEGPRNLTLSNVLFFLITGHLVPGPGDESSSRWCRGSLERGCQLRCRPRHLTEVQNYELGGNLLSIGRTEEKGFEVEFLNGEAKVTGKNGETVLTAKRKGRLCIIEEYKSSVLYITRTENEELWHRRMGHPHYNAIKKLDLTVSKSESSPTLNDPVFHLYTKKDETPKFP